MSTDERGEKVARRWRPATHMEAAAVVHMARIADARGGMKCRPHGGEILSLSLEFRNHRN